MLDERTPVIVGAGVATPHIDDLTLSKSAFELMLDATRRAAADSGAPGLLSKIDVVSVPQGSWTHRNPGGDIALTVGSPDARSVILKAGTPQQTLFNDAYRAILDGTIDVALIVGGEAARRSVLARRAGIELADLDGDSGEPDEVREPAGEIVSALEIQAGLWTPVQQYALIDSALRHAERQSVNEHRDDIAALWAGFSRVAVGFEHAAFREARTAEFIRESGPDNRLMAFPYNKWHCSQMNVDQAAAFFVTSLGAATAAGVDPSRLVFPLVALESSASVAVIRRRELHRWPAMQVLADAATGHLERALDTIDNVELYSCFPAAVRVQQRELGLPVDGVPTITGGEPFAGGPWNNFVLQATAAMIDRLREQSGSLGMVTTVSGFLNKPGIAVYSTEPGDQPLLVADLADEATRATATQPIATNADGSATVAAYTITAEPSGAERLIALVDTPDDERWIVFSHDPLTAGRFKREELIGTEVQVHGVDFEVPQ